MYEGIICQGRQVSVSDLGWLQNWVEGHPGWSRHRLAVELCRLWQWETAKGRPKNYAARSFLMKLERRGLLSLPPVRETMRRWSWKKPFEAKRDWVPESVAAPLGDLFPIQIVRCVSGSPEERRFRSYLARHHYLGFAKTIGENLQYLAKDREGRDLACLLFGSAAWKAQDRDRFIGWDENARSRHLNLTTNNTRFLILPWVHVPHLASHLLGTVLRRLSFDWQDKYGHPIHWVETFVEKGRFPGTCYRAANWLYVGETKGRSRQDRDQTLCVPVKAIYLYPLHRRFREVLCR